MPFVLTASLVSAGAARPALDVGAALLLTGALVWWIRANRIRMELLGRRDAGWREATIAMTPSEQPSTSSAGKPRR